MRGAARSLIDRFRALFSSDARMRLAEKTLRRYYTRKLDEVWGGSRPPPEWFDHRIDLYLWSERRDPSWVERGVFSREVMFAGCRVLDLCCGGGFYAYYFYAEIASHVDAVDRDPSALAHARQWHSHPKISFVPRDAVADDFPADDYDVITWNGALEHFNLDEIHAVLAKCARALRARNGVLCGHATSARSPDRGNPDHVFEVDSAEQLKRFLRAHFPHAGTLETRHLERHNIYFRAAFDPSRLRRFE